MLHTDFLLMLERVRSIDARLLADELRGQPRPFLARRWLVVDGHLTHILVPVLDSEQEVELDIDDVRQTYSYNSLECRGRVITRPLSDIALYVLNPDAWMDDVCALLEIEPSRRTRTREIIAGHLWHLGDIRVGQTHRFAPVYLARRVDASDQDLRRALINVKRPSQGIVLTAHDVDLDLPNSHQACWVGHLLLESSEGVRCDTELLQRMLKGSAADADDRDEYFDNDTGELKLACMAEPKIFKGKQRAVIAQLWKARTQSGMKWSDVIERTRCGKDPDSVFGSKWTAWLERIEGQHGHYRLRTRR